ncbi:Fungal lipase-like domain [Dillenia turbinata]|uniref:Fungal lipase-like domain n=1 Tax=Dillenia turbinata TaxID=194707 RepID=A0AAN8UIP8_9MAGN
MATATMATAVGAAALLYYTLNRKLESNDGANDENEKGSDLQNNVTLGIDRVSHRLIRAPATWLETIWTLSETLRFTYSETLGKWPIGDLAFGITFLLKRQGNLLVSSVFGGSDSVQLKGPEITAELRYLLNLLTLCWHFSKKPFPLFLEETGYSQENVLLQEPKAGLLKPAFTILVDHKTKHLLLLIRGTHSIKDTLTAATGAVVPFHHSVVHEGGVSNLVLGYAHCGMVAAARWIAKLATPCLVKALGQYPDYQLKIVGHSLGGGTAALLTYILREQKELSRATCVTFAPAACMTWELAKSGNHVITSVINGADLVPTFSAASMDDLRAEVTASAWLNDLRNQIERTRILSTVYRSATALGAHLPSIAGAKAKVAGAGAMMRPVSNGTQVVMRRAQSIAQAAWSRPHFGLSSWSCIGPRQRPVGTRSNSMVERDSSEPSSFEGETLEPLLTSPDRASTSIQTTQGSLSRSEGSELTSKIECSYSDNIVLHAEMETDVDDGDDLMGHNRHDERMTEVELWQQLEHELYDQQEDEEADVENDLRQEEAAAIAKASEARPGTSIPEVKEAHRFFPPGKIMHIVTLHSNVVESEGEAASSDLQNNQSTETKVGIFLAPRTLYSKIRLSQSMISDHFMPVYRRQIEKLIAGLEKEETSEGNHSTNKS